MTYRTVIGTFLIATFVAVIPSLSSAQVEDDRHAEYARAERMFCMLYGARPDSALLGDTQRLMNRSA
jgi:hypothetical protein